MLINLNHLMEMLRLLIIKKEQFDSFGIYMKKNFEQRMHKYLQDKFPEHSKKSSSRDIRTLVQNGIQKAEHYNIEYENDIRRFLEYVVIYGIQLDIQKETHWIRDILQRNDVSGRKKMDFIDDSELQELRIKM